MMKTFKLFLGLFIAVALMSSNIYSQDAISLGGPGISFAIGDSCGGTGTLQYDNGTFENGYGWNVSVTDGRNVMKFTPPSYPWNFTKMCIAITRTAAGGASFTFDVVFYDTTGVGGAPGATPVYTLANQTISGILIYPAYSWYNFAVTPPPLPNGSYYVGIKFNPAGSGQNNKYIMADENNTTIRPGYGWANAGPWTTLQTYFPLYKALGIRTLGSGAPPPAGFCQGFNTTTFPPTGWTVAGTPLLWLYHAVSGYGNGTGSAKADFYAIATGTAQLNSITLTSPTAAGDSLIFQDAYCTYQTENDQLQILTSTNGGTTWVSLITLNGGVGGPLVTAPPQLAEFTPTANQWKYQRLALPIGINKIQFNAITAYGNNLFIDSICYKPGIIGINNNNGIAENFSLSQNYPNPFNPSTQISFSLPKAADVKLVVFDILGREVITLVNEFKQAGNHSIEFNASTLSSGVYFYRLVTDNFTDTKKMLLIK